MADLLLGVSLRAAGAISSFALTWFIVQIFGAHVLGLYQIGFATATLLGTAAILGQHVILIRTVAPLIRDEKHEETSGVFRAIMAFAIKVAIGLTAVSVLGAWPLSVYGLGESEATLFVIAISPIILTIPVIRLQNALLRCHGDVKASQSLEGVFFTSFAALVLAVLWFFQIAFPALFVPLFLVTGHLLAVGIGYVLVSRKLVKAPKEKGVVDVAAGAWIAAPSTLSAGVSWLTLLIIAALLSPADAGIFRVAIMICMLMELVQTSFATMVGPYLSRAAQAGNIFQIRKIILTAGVIGIALASPVGAVSLFAPEWILSVFGEEYIAGATALQLLAIGELINVATGPLGIALIMQNRERHVLVNAFASNLIGLAVTILLLPSWGLAGAGAGLLVSSLVRNGANATLLWLIKPQPAPALDT